IDELTVVLQTPLRFKYENRLQGDMPFHILIRTALRRIADVNNHWGDGEPPLDYRGLVRHAEEVETAESNLKWLGFRRYSNRQERSVSMGGLTGHVKYRGNLNRFVPLLHYCEQVHLGKATTFGFGKIGIALHDSS
ncbi:MAG: CRISPR system precrRNA processing endoribonuclease RAMP protein Cas6, partial [Pseudomonadota bacterium]